MTLHRWARTALLLLLATPITLSPALAATPATKPEAKAAAKAADDSKSAAKNQPVDGPAPTDLPGWCKAIGERLTALPLNQCLNTGLAPGDGRSVRGVPLWFRDIRPTKGQAALRVFVIGGIHGDEMTSVNLVFDWLERATKNPDERVHWRMVPLVNPDGLLRKPATRTNGRGVDLNRNFPTADWASNAHNYWITRTNKDPRRYPGPQAVSEPETKWLQKQLDQFKPNLIVAVHAPYGVLDFDGPPPPPDKLGSLYLDQVGIYPGSLGNFGGVVRGIPVVTIELKNARKVATPEISAMWTDLRDWMDKRLINVAQAPGSSTKAR